MKVKVSDTVNGELNISALGKTVASGVEIPLSEEQFLHSSTQWCIRNGLLEVIEGSAKQSEGVEYRSVYKNALSIRCIGRAVNPGEVFFVDGEHLEDGELCLAESKGYIIKESEFRKSKKKKKSKVEAVAKDVASEENIPVKESRAEVQVGQIKKVVPEGMYAHEPEAIKTKNKETRLNEILDLDLDIPIEEEQETISFVDKEQDKERRANSSKIAKDNEEVI